MPVDLTDRIWELVQEQMPLCSCGRRLMPGWGMNSPVAVCTPCSSVSLVSVEDMAQAVANARAIAEREDDDE